MKVHQVSGSLSPALATALLEFEKPFTYPLGPGRFFRISHGEDYSLFFRAQGDGCCFVAEHKGRVAGTLGTSIRRLWMPDGTERFVAYVGDLKIAAEARGGIVLARLARAAAAWLRPRVEAGYGIVMGGTTMTPEAYTGRVGIPGFQDLGRLVLLRISGSIGLEAKPEHFLSNRGTALACYRRLSVGRYACLVGDAEDRSQIEPTWFMNPDGSACGMLEDTRKAKQLITDDGSELLTAHCSCFAYSSISAGAELINAALNRAVQLGFPALFVSVPETDTPELKAALHGFELQPAPAIVYGTGLTAGVWNINTSEI
jgi:hypothetical protein